MPLKLNPLTGELDLVGENGAAAGQTKLTGDVGAAVSPDGADSISLIGDATQAYLQTTGTPASNKFEVKLIEPAEDGELLIGHTANGEPSVATLTAGNGINITNGAGAITVTSTATSALTVPTDSGTATSVAGSMDFFGGTGVDTAGSGNTITINASAVVPTSFTTDSGTATPTGNSLSVSGGTGINSSGSGAALTITLDTPVTIANGGTGASSFTAGSVVFSNGSILTQNNSNLFWDDTLTRLGIGTITPRNNLEVCGNSCINHVSTEDTDHAFQIGVDAAGFGDIKAIQIDYETGGIGAGSENAVILVNINEILANGGEIFAMEVLATTEGTDTVGGLKLGVGVSAIHQMSGTFVDIDNILNIAVDVTAALANGGAGNISIFVADNDTITLGDAAVWGETEVIVGTGASGSGIAPTFEYSTGGAGFTAFTPVDGTNGFRNSGIIDWDSGDLAGWATNASGLFEIRITRTRNSLTTTPIVDELQISSATEYNWDKDGAVNIKSLSLDDALTVANGGTGTTSLTDGGVLLGSGTAAVTALGQATNGQLVIGSTGADPVVASVTAGGGISIAEGAGSLTISTISGGFPWTVVTDATQALAVNNAYIGNRGTTITYTIPTTAAIGSVIKITNIGAGLPVIAQNAGESINIVGSTTTVGVGGSLTATEQFDSIELVCIVADTTWNVLSITGNWTVA